MANDGSGTLIIIGGHEDKDGACEILREIASRVGDQKLIVAAIASRDPKDYFADYRATFGRLGINDIVNLYTEDDSDDELSRKAALIDEAAGIFFTGGDQSRIFEQIGGTIVEKAVQSLFERGGVVAGTSAGASIMGSTMLIKGKGEQTYRVGKLETASGFGLLANVVIDQHFAERGRIGRLLGAIAENPDKLGLGIDEDTAIIVEGSTFEVAGSGAVYVLNWGPDTKSNVSGARHEEALSMTGVLLDVLSKGDVFDLESRTSHIHSKN